MTDPARRAGRPRDSSIDRDAIAATLELLGEVGFDATSMQRIAARAGVHASALYRRWPSRIELIEDAISPFLAISTIEPSGDLRTDLGLMIDAYSTAFSAPAARSAIPGLLAHYASVGSVRRPEQWLEVSVRPSFIDILRAAPSTMIDPDVDPDDVFDVVLGALLARVTVPTVLERDRGSEPLVELTLRMLTPRSVASADSTAPTRTKEISR